MASWCHAGVLFLLSFMAHCGVVFLVYIIPIVDGQVSAHLKKGSF